MNIDKKQLIYLHRVLSRSNEHWLLYESEKLNTGWAPQIRVKLAEYGLEENFDRIKITSTVEKGGRSQNGKNQPEETAKRVL